MKKKYDIFRFQCRLGDNYWLEGDYDDDGNCIGWELYNINYREVTEKTVPIMTSETHTFEELKQYVKKHRTYNMLDYYNSVSTIILILLLVNVNIRMIWENFNTDFVHGMYYGMYTVWLVIILMFIVISYRNNKSHRLYIRGRYDYLFEKWEEKYDKMGNTK